MNKSSHSLNRRSVVLGGVATAGLLAQSTKLLANISIGNANLTTVSDGNLVLPKSFFFSGLPQDELQSIMQTYGLEEENLEPECNLAILRDGDNTVLFDVGSGPDFMPSAGKIVDGLASIDLSPEDITHVVFTHAHPDHIWGLLDDFDEPLFSEASYHIGRAEWDYWWNPETINTIGDARAAFAAGAKRRLEAIEDNVTMFDPDQEILPGVQAIATYGHTPGHMAFSIQDKALIVGDAIANQHVAFHHPDWANGADQIPDQAIKTRQMLLERLANENMAVVGFHLPNGGIGQVDAKDGAFRFRQES